MAGTTKTRRCPECELTLPETDFKKRSGPDAEKRNRSGQPYGYCKRCRIARRSKPRARFTSMLPKMRRRAKERGFGFDIDQDFLLDLLAKQQFKCAVTGLDMTLTSGQGRTPTNVSVDRINPNLGYTRDNVRLVCSVINTMRGTMSDTELAEWAQHVITGRQEKKWD